jgi:hypothetical protein
MMRKTTDSDIPQAPKDFMQENLPRHQPIEALRAFMSAPQEASGKSFLEYVSAFESTADTTKTRPTNLLDLYAQDIREIYFDAQRRPEHYNERQHAILQQLVAKMPGNITNAEKNELLLTFIRPSVPKKERDRRILEQEKLRKKREQEENEKILLEDGRSLADAIEDEKSDWIFEKQNFSDKIIV